MSWNATGCHVANLETANPWQYLHSDKGWEESRQAHCTQLSLVSTHVDGAHLHLQEEHIFDLRWVWKRLKKTISTLGTGQATNKQPCDYMTIWFPQKKFLCRLTAEVSFRRMTVISMSVQTHLCLPRPRPLPWQHHR